jgi:murein DD-endopeptidase MepM/ murein hydrolase activator NlpD
MYAVDLLQPSQDGVVSVGGALRARRPETYPSFGEPVLAMAPGTVVRVSDTQRDHGARNTWPLLLWMLTVEGFLRELAGAPHILGNHVIVQQDDGTYAAYAHLKRGSASVRSGQRVLEGHQLAQVGNTGNTSEPHLHVQLMDRVHPTAAAGIPMHWPDLVSDPAERDPRWTTGPKPTAQPAFPANGQIFQVEESRNTRLSDRGADPDGRNR